MLRVYIIVLLLHDGCAVDLLLDKCMGQVVLLTRYCSGNQIEKNVMGGACSTYVDSRDVYRVLVGKPEGKRQPERLRSRRGIIIRWIFTNWDVGVWTGSSWLRIETGGEHL